MANMKRNRYFGLHIWIMLIILITFLFVPIVLAGSTIKITSNTNLVNATNLTPLFPKTIYEQNLEINLNEDGGVDENGSIRYVLQEETYNKTALVEIQFSMDEEFKNFNIYDLDNKEITFEEVSNIPDLNTCTGKYILNKKTNQVRACIKISKEEEIAYGWSIHILPKNVYGIQKDMIYHSLNYSFLLGNYSYPLSIGVYGGSNVILDYKGQNKKCPLNLGYIPLSNGFMCNGNLFYPEHENVTISVTPRGYNKLLLEKRKQTREYILDKIIWVIGSIIIALIVAYITNRKTKRDIEEKFKKEIKEIKNKIIDLENKRNKNFKKN